MLCWAPLYDRLVGCVEENIHSERNSMAAIIKVSLNAPMQGMRCVGRGVEIQVRLRLLGTTASFIPTQPTALAFNNLGEND